MKAVTWHVDTTKPHGQPGEAPTQAAEWAVQMVAKAGTIGTTLKIGNCNHRRCLPELVAALARHRDTCARSTTSRTRPTVEGSLGASRPAGRETPRK
ncbi:MAG TPA: hypothetical protein VFJ09_16655 [Nocardioidaceae bacterium]|nr:hypothetical protein [Nocardioidaceae bacterium]